MDTHQSHEGLNLELSLRPPLPLRPQPRPPPPLPTPALIPHPSSPKLSRTKKDIQHPNPQSRRRKRKKPNTMAIEPPYPWSTKQRAVIHELDYLRSKNIVTVTGDVKCSRCKEKYRMEYDVMEKFNELASYIEINRDTLHDRAPSSWMQPVLPNCMLCNQQNCVEPLIPETDHKRINWLFLLLGQMLGRLKLGQLKYFCTHTKNHRTGAKDRLIYVTYLSLCKQLQPFNRLFHHR